MSKSSSSQQVGVRLPTELLAMVDQVAQLYVCERPDAIRHIISFGAPLLIAGRGINLSRVLMALEILVEDCLKKVSEEGQAELQALLKTAQKNYENHHA